MYDHQASREVHSVEGAEAALRMLFTDGVPQSVLDIGCGTGTWLRAALNCGAQEVLGVDGVAIPGDQLLIPESAFRIADLNAPLRLDRRFDLVLCLETAEHLDAESAATVIASLAAHGDHILFSAAAPGQPGINHHNCQWPDFWQALFNREGFACSDEVRWLIWDNHAIEPWYRQNLMLAVRDPARAGSEARIAAVIHPAMLDIYTWDAAEKQTSVIERGSMPWSWYLSAPVRAAAAKLRRRLK